jgi:hypothetical protein
LQAVCYLEGCPKATCHLFGTQTLAKVGGRASQQSPWAASSLTSLRCPENLSRELLTPAAVELVVGLTAEAAELVLELAGESAQLVLGLVADLTERGA